MTLASLFNDVTILGVLLLLGFIVRELVKPLQRLYIPSSVIGGAIGLILGPQVLGIIDIPSTFEGMSGVLINLIMAATVFGTKIDKSRVRGYLDYTFVTTSNYGLQLCVGVAIGMAMKGIWSNLPHGWGIMGVFWLELVTTFFIPILIYSIVMIVIAAGSSILLAKRFCKDDWFEKAMMSYGMGTGAVPTGLALVRAVDPKMESSAPDAHGVAATLFTPIFGVLPAVGPIIAMNSELTLIGIGLAITGVSMLLGFLLFGRKK